MIEKSDQNKCFVLSIYFDNTLEDFSKEINVSHHNQQKGESDEIRLGEITITKPPIKKYHYRMDNFYKKSVLENYYDKYKEIFEINQNNHQERMKFLFEMLNSFRNKHEFFNNLHFDCNPLHLDPGPSNTLVEMEKSCMLFILEKSRKNSSESDKMWIDALILLGMSYEHGIFGCKYNGDKASAFYSIACREKHPFGTYKLAQCMERSGKSLADVKKATTFYRCAAKLGDLEAMHTYGCILITGELGCPKDIGSGLIYLKIAVKCADERYPHPFYDLAHLFENASSFEEIIEDDYYAYELYHKGAQFGDSNCQFRLGKIYEKGEFYTEKNLNTAIKYYTEAANNLHVDALYKMARFYLDGIPNVIMKDVKQTYFHAVKGAAKGHIQCMYLVGYLYEYGLGTFQDNFSALWWYEIAAFYGSMEANSKCVHLRAIVDIEKSRMRPASKCRLG